MHNTRAQGKGWVTLGNQLDGTAFQDPEVIAKFKKAYPGVDFRDLNVRPFQPEIEGAEALERLHHSSTMKKKIAAHAAAKAAKAKKNSTTA